MATSYPGGIDSLNDPTPTSPMNNPSHAGEHDSANDAIEAIETTVGVTGSFNFLPVVGGTMSGPVAMSANKITGVANGSASSDVAAFGQIPAALPPNGAAGGSLTGSYPNPTIATVPSGATATTQTALDNSTKVSTTAYTDSAVGVETSARTSAEALKAPLASPTFTGTPLAPTASPGTNTTQLATTAFVEAALPSGGSSLGGGVYGDGSDGAAHFIATGAVTVAGATLSSGVYTMTRDIFGSGMTIDSTVIIVTNGFRIFDNGTLTNNGTIEWNGNGGAAGTTTGGNGGAALGVTASAGTTTGSATVGQAGGAGGTTSAGTVGTTQATTPSLGGAGGHGGSGSTSAGGVGGTVTGPTVYQSGMRAIPGAILWRVFAGATIYPFMSGAGGGGGGGLTSVGGGGGGGAGGSVGVYAYKFSGTGAIQARGGAGGSGTAVGNGGGGGGGGGGIVIVISTSVSSGAISGQTIDANGGALGSSYGSSTGGTAGSSGTVYLIPG